MKNQYIDYIKTSLFLPIKKYLIIFILIFLFPSLCFSANHYIRQDATGSNNGSDWTNAWTDLPATLVRGDTYYIADGNYGSYTFNDAVSGTTYIYIKKATTTAHGTETGWNNSYGDGQAEFIPPLFINTSYWDIDGVTGSGSSSSSYGFTIDAKKYEDIDLLISLGNNIVSNLSLKHFSLLHWLNLPLDGTTKGWRQIYWNPIGGRNNNIYIGNCYFNGGVNQILMRSSDNTVIENNYFNVNSSNYYNHGTGIGAYVVNHNTTVRYNIFKDIAGTAVISFEGNDWSIYGNIFFETSESQGNAANAIRGGRQLCLRMLVYNNTFYNITGSGHGSGVLVENTGSSAKIRNNLWFNCSSANIHGYTYPSSDPAGFLINVINDTKPSGTLNFTGTWNNKATGDLRDNPFVSLATNNIRLSAATPAVTPLTAPYNVDFAGVARGADGVWDLGAYEFTNASGDDIAPPTGLMIINQ